MVGLMFAMALLSHAPQSTIAIPGGRIEATLPNPPHAVSDAIANECLNEGWSIEERTDARVICRSKGYPALFNARSTSADMYRFELFAGPSGTTIRGTSSLTTTNIFGQVSESEGLGGRDMLAALRRINATFPAGTLFGPEDIGISGAIKRKAFSAGFLVETVKPDTPAAKAGLMPGDLIREVDASTFNDEDRMTQLFADSGGGATLKVQRGKSQIIAFVRLN